MQELTRDSKTPNVNGDAKSTGTVMSSLGDAVLDSAGRTAEAFDWSLSLPRRVGAWAKDVPIVGLAAAEVGRTTSNILLAVHHTVTGGLFHWLEQYRRAHAVDAALASTVEADLRPSSELERNLEAQSLEAIEQRAAGVADLLILKAENHYKDGLGALAGKVTAQWDSGEPSAMTREGLRDQLRGILVSVYRSVKDKHDPSGSLAALKHAMERAFMIYPDAVLPGL